MRNLLLLRHAKTEPGRNGGRDHDRRLTERGRHDAVLVGRFLTAAELVPDLVLTSPAARARETAELVIEAGGWPVSLREVPALYDSSTGRALDVVRSCGSDGATLLVVGHEPTWSSLAAILIGGGALRMPTAGLAHLAFDEAGWAGVTPGSGSLRGLVTPAMVRGLPPLLA